MTKESTALAVHEAAPIVKASSQLAAFLGIESGMMLDTIKAQCFKSTTPDKVTDEQLAAFISVANTLKLNPLLSGMLYCYPAKNGGIEPMIGPDGIFTLLANNPDIVKQDDGGPAWYTEQAKEGAEDVCTAYINHATKGLLKKKIYLAEWVVGSNPNWQSRRRHMADVRALKQCARQVIHGIPFDEDERTIAEMVNVTNTATQAPAEPPPPRPDPAKLRRGRQGPSASQTTEPAKTETINVDATPAPEVAQSSTPPKADAPKASEPALTVAPRTTLEKKEELVGVQVKVVSAAYENFGEESLPVHGVVAKVTGGWEGDVYDLAGGMMGSQAGPDGVKQVGKPLPIWTPGALLTLDLKGRFSAAQKTVLAIASNVTATPKAANKQSGLGLE